MSMSICIQQPLSLRKRIECCGLRRGDTALVEFAVGVLPSTNSLSLCFCSSYIRRIGDIRKGWPWQRFRSFPSTVFIRNDDALSREIPKERGMFYARASVLCGPAISLLVLPSTIAFFPESALPIKEILAEEPAGCCLYPNDPVAGILSSCNGVPLARTIVCNIMPYLDVVADDNQDFVHQ